MTPRRKTLLTLFKLADLGIVTAAFVLAVGITLGSNKAAGWLAVLGMRITVQNALFVAAYLTVWHFVLRTFGLYRSYRLSPAFREWRDLSLAVFVGAAPLVPLSVLFNLQFVTMTFLSTFTGLTLLTLGMGRRTFRTVGRWLRTRGRNLRNAIVIADGEAGLEISSSLVTQNELGYRVIEIIEVDRTVRNGDRKTAEVIQELGELLENRPVDEVFVALALDSSQSLIRTIILLCEEQGVMVRLGASLADLSWGRAVVDEVGGRPVLTIFSGPPDTLRLIAKRAIDLVGATIGLLVLTPLFVAIAIAVKLDSRGSVLFLQERVGYNRRRFRAYKFRTMVDGAEGMQPSLEPLNEARGPIFKIRNDPRITRVGRWLRRMSLDELPQLMNVLKGEMSLVGPRPLPLRDVKRIDVRWHKRRFSVRPGITCLWQANGREPDFDEWIKADMEYIDKWSLILDLKILLRTIPAVLSGQGAH